MRALARSTRNIASTGAAAKSALRPHSMEVFWTRSDGLLYRDMRKGFDPTNFKTRRKGDVRVDNGAMHCRENDAHAHCHQRVEQLQVYYTGHSRGRGEDVTRHCRKNDK